MKLSTPLAVITSIRFSDTLLITAPPLPVVEYSVPVAVVSTESYPINLLEHVTVSDAPLSTMKLICSQFRVSKVSNQSVQTIYVDVWDQTYLTKKEMYRVSS